MSQPSRRAVIAALVGGGAVVAVGGAAALVVLTDDDGGDDPTASPVAEVDADAALVAVGERYLRDHPEEADADVLVAAVPALAGTTSGPISDPAALLASLRGQVADDFAADAVVEVDGWVLALTEARAAALFTLER